MLKTPLTVLLVLRCLILLSVGEAGASSMAESTLLKGGACSCTSAAIVVMVMLASSYPDTREIDRDREMMLQ